MSLTVAAGILVAGLANGSLIPAAKAQVSGASFTARNGTLAGGVITAQGVVINGIPTDGVFAGRVNIGNSFVESPCGIAAAGNGVYMFGMYPSGRPTSDPSLTGMYPSGNPTGDPSLTGMYPSGNPTSDPSLTGMYPSGNPTGDPSLTGMYPSGNPTGDPSLTGMYPSGNPTSDPSLTGMYPSGNPSPSQGGMYPSGRGTFIGDAQVFGGVLEGDHVEVRNGVITGGNLRVVGAYVTAVCAR